MSTVLLVWVVFSVLLEHALIVAPVDIVTHWKLALYYVSLWPALALLMLKNAVNKIDARKKLGDWFKSPLR